MGKRKRQTSGSAYFSKREFKALRFLIREALKVVSGERKFPADPGPVKSKSKIAMMFCSDEEELIIGETTPVLSTERDNGSRHTPATLGGSQE